MPTLTGVSHNISTHAFSTVNTTEHQCTHTTTHQTDKSSLISDFNFNDKTTTIKLNIFYLISKHKASCHM